MSKKVVLITGASSGIGEAIARNFSKHNYCVAIHYRSGKDRAEKIMQDLMEQGNPDVSIHEADLSEPANCKKLQDEVESRYGRIDVLVNNAGAAEDKPFLFLGEADVSTTFQRNLTSPLILARHVAKGMVKRKYGRIINISSIVASVGNPGQTIYASSKGALESATKTMAVELARFGVTANCIAPGFIDTPMTAKLPEKVKTQLLSMVPVGRLGNPNEVAEAIIFLASDGASYITGSTIHVNGGMYQG